MKGRSRNKHEKEQEFLKAKDTCELSWDTCVWDTAAIWILEESLGRSLKSLREN